MTKRGHKPSPGDWLGERVALDALDYPIPMVADRWTYMLGGLTASFFARSTAK